MNVVWALLITAAATAFAIGAFLLVRRHAPEGGFFADGDRSAGFFGVLSAAFAILVGFVVFLAFESFDASRSGAETEALVVAQQFETAQLLPIAARPSLDHAIVCYARAVVGIEWPQMESGGQGNLINPWGIALFRALQPVNPKTAAQQAAYSKWLDQTSDRQEARNSRIHGAQGVIPSALWIVLVFMALVLFVFMLFFADSGERAASQAVQIGAVAAVIVATLFVVRFLNSPFHAGVSGLRPVAMERTLHVLDQERKIVGDRGALPCDARGRPAAA
jgi:hypothetical protein